MFNMTEIPKSKRVASTSILSQCLLANANWVNYKKARISPVTSETLTQLL